MELELGLALPSFTFDLNKSAATKSTSNRDTFEEAFGDSAGSENRPDESCQLHRVLVGWPPIKTLGSRKRSREGCRKEEEVVKNGEEESEEWRDKGIWVKVRMEGVAIGRKLDLCLLHSYDELSVKLCCMFFGQYDNHAYEKRDRKLAVAYENFDGDWILVGDVAWGDFAQSVRRLHVFPDHCAYVRSS